jgi:hypothetical protein
VKFLYECGLWRRKIAGSVGTSTGSWKSKTAWTAGDSCLEKKNSCSSLGSCWRKAGTAAGEKLGQLKKENSWETSYTKRN